MFFSRNMSQYLVFNKFPTNALTKFSLINCFEHIPAIPLDRHPTSIV